MGESGYIELGTIGRPHGFKGAFVLHTPSGNESSLGYLKRAFLADKPEYKEFEIESARWMPKGWKLKLTVLNSEDDIKPLRNRPLFAKRTDLKEPGKGEYYVDDLVGLQVIDSDSGNPIGTLVAVEFSGQDRWQVDTGKEKLWIPAVSHFIKKVDPKGRKIWIQNREELG